MATETLRPNAAGDEQNNAVLNPGTGEAAWEDVDEAVADDAATCVGDNEATWIRDLYNIENSSVGSGTINQIEVFGRFRCKTNNPDQNNIKICIKSGLTVAEQEFQNSVAETWENFSKVWTVNPDTSSAWTWSEINSLQIGFASRKPYTGGANRTDCTQLYVEVDYTPISAIVKISDETIGIGDSAVQRLRSVRLISETIGIAESAVRRLRSIRLIYEAITLSDSGLRRLFSVRISTETISLAETALRRSRLVKVLNEALSIGDSFIKVNVIVKIMNEAISISESFLKKLTSLAFIGQIVNFFFFKRATVQADVVLKQEGVLKTFPADLVIAPHFEQVSVEADALFMAQKLKTLPADAVMKVEKTLEFGADMVLWQPYVPPEELETEQKKMTYFPYVKIAEIE